MPDSTVNSATIISIEVVYANPQEQAVLALNVPQGMTAEEAMVTSGILQRFPEITLSEVKVGIFGAICPLGHVLKQGDRVEIYRPLLRDPKEARRQRAMKQK